MSNDLTGMAGMSQKDLEQSVRDEYARLRAAGFSAVRGLPKSAEVAWNKQNQGTRWMTRRQ
jgi:hypothetical protein